MQYYTGSSLEVSIHAPVRERLGLAERRTERKGFNPRPRKGATSEAEKKLYGYEFQSTPP